MDLAQQREIHDQIIWPDKPPRLGKGISWGENKSIVLMLCRIGQVTKWQKGYPNQPGYQSMPEEYEVDGVRVQFLPHWGHMMVGPHYMMPLSSAYRLKKAVDAAKTLESMAYKP